MAFSEVTENNHAGVVWTIALLCLVYSVLTYITRGFIKWNLLGWDDWAITGAQVRPAFLLCFRFSMKRIVRSWEIKVDC
jgi:hypothetical protein